MNPIPSRKKVFPLLLVSIIALVLGTWAGLVRLGWHWRVDTRWLMEHGPLMVSAFLGTLIGVERAVALGQWWTFTGPAMTGLGGIILLAAPGHPAGLWLVLIGSVLVIPIFYLILQRQPLLATWIMAFGTVMWVIGNALWVMQKPIPLATLWWIGYLTLTIVGERLELARLLVLTRRILSLLYAALFVLTVGMVVGVWSYPWGVRILGVGLIGIGAWLSQYDIARRTIRQKGLPKFVAASLLTGYVWIIVSGILALLNPTVMAGFKYDAWLHAFFLGFIFSMIFGHAPVIFPSVLSLPIVFRPWAYGYLGLLHISLILRVAGDLTMNMTWRRWGGILNGFALLFFLLDVIYAVLTTRGKKLIG